MAHITAQSHYEYKWWGDVGTILTPNSTQTIADTIEYVLLSTSGTGGFSLTLPEVTDPLDTTQDVLMTRKLIFIGDVTLGSNNVTLLANGTGVTIAGESSFVMDSDNQHVKLELLNKNWAIVVDTIPTLTLGSFHMHSNAVITAIATINTNTDIAGTATASSLNSNFTFSTSPNALTYVGVPDITVMLTITTSMSKVNSSDKVFRILGIKNGSEIEGCNIATNILKAMIEVSVSYPVLLSTNDVVKSMIRNETDTENVDVTDLVMTMNEISK